MMLAEVKREYVLTTVDPAIAPEVKSEPGRALICILGTALGGLIGAVIALTRYYSYKKEGSSHSKKMAFPTSKA